MHRESRLRPYASTWLNLRAKARARRGGHCYVTVGTAPVLQPGRGSNSRGGSEGEKGEKTQKISHIISPFFWSQPVRRLPSGHGGEAGVVVELGTQCEKLIGFCD
jgi:hypothetical protein